MNQNIIEGFLKRASDIMHAQGPEFHNIIQGLLSSGLGTANSVGNINPVSSPAYMAMNKNVDRIGNPLEDPNTPANPIQFSYLQKLLGSTSSPNPEGHTPDNWGQMQQQMHSRSMRE